jgi:hypothetical protein
MRRDHQPDNEPRTGIVQIGAMFGAGRISPDLAQIHDHILPKMAGRGGGPDRRAANDLSKSQARSIHVDIRLKILDGFPPAWPLKSPYSISMTSFAAMTSAEG